MTKMNLSNFGTHILVSEGCGECGKVTLRIPHQLLADMLKNCERSNDRDILICKLKNMEKSMNLSACLDREKIWDLVEDIAFK